MSNTPMVYLASPYTHDDVAVMCERLQASMTFEEGLIRAGVRVYNPLRYTTSFDYTSDPAQHDAMEDYWRQHGLTMLDACDQVFALHMPGWQDSVGLADEVSKAREVGTPVRIVADTPDGIASYTERDYRSFVYRITGRLEPVYPHTCERHRGELDAIKAVVQAEC